MSSQPSASPLDPLPHLPPRPLDANKGTFGRVLVVAGSRGMAGAAALCGQAALRGGAGLVRVAVPAEVLPIVATANPCYLTHPLPQDDQGMLAATAGAEVAALLAGSTALALGPGLGRGPGVEAVVRRVVGQAGPPAVLDADALNVLVSHLDPLRGPRGPLVLTPHPGEFARLLGVGIPAVQAARTELAVRFALAHDLVVVLKGHGTVITDGRRVAVNTTGNPGMATGGTGDVLTGLVAALLGQGLEPFAAARLGVYLHGLAGDLARDEVGEVSLIASDLLAFLPRAFQAHARGRPGP